MTTRSRPSSGWASPRVHDTLVGGPPRGRENRLKNERWVTRPSSGRAHVRIKRIPNTQKGTSHTSPGIYEKGGVMAEEVLSCQSTRS